MSTSKISLAILSILFTFFLGSLGFLLIATIVSNGGRHCEAEEVRRRVDCGADGKSKLPVVILGIAMSVVMNY